MGDRHPFGGSLPDWVFEKNDEDVPVFTGGAVLQFWNHPTTGTEYEDLTEDAEGTAPITALLSEDGTGDFELGSIPPFYGPPDVTSMWVSAEGGPRKAIFSRDIGDLAGQALLQLQQHVSQQNGHQTTLDVLTDVDVAEPGSRPDGAFLAWDLDTLKFVLAATTGLNPDDFVATASGSTIRIPDGNTTGAAETIRVPAGTRTGNAWRVYWNSGSDGTPVWFETFWLDPFGHPRVQANADARIGFKVLRKSSGATADMQQWCNEAGTPLAWVAADGRVRSPNVGRSVCWTAKDTVSAGSGGFYFRNLTGVTLTLRALSFHLGTACTSGAIVFDPKVNGTSLYPTGKPSLATGVADSGVITSAFTVAAGALVTIDISGTFDGAEDLTAQADFV